MRPSNTFLSNLNSALLLDESGINERCSTSGRHHVARELRLAGGSSLLAEETRLGALEDARCCGAILMHLRSNERNERALCLLFVPDNEGSNVGNTFNPGPDGMVYLPYFQPLASEFDLIICSAEEIETTVVQHANKIASAVDSFAKPIQSWKALRGELFSAQIPLPDQLTGDTELTDTTPQYCLLGAGPQNIGTDI